MRRFLLLLSGYRIIHDVKRWHDAKSSHYVSNGETNNELKEKEGQNFVIQDGPQHVELLQTAKVDVIMKKGKSGPSCLIPTAI